MKEAAMMKLFGRKSRDDLHTRLAAARSAFAGLELAEPALAHEAAAGDPADTEKFRQCRLDIEAAQADIAMLEKAIAHEADQAAKKREAKILGERERVIQDALRIAQKRIEVGERFVGEIRPAMKSYSQIQQLTSELISLVPLHQPAEPGLGLYAGEIRQFVADEIFRLDGLPLLSGENESIAFPQQKRSVFDDHVNAPHLMRPLVERLHGALQAIQREMETRAVWPSSNAASKSNAQAEHDAAIAGAAAAIPQI
jgi:hypothetical protein